MTATRHYSDGDRVDAGPEAAKLPAEIEVYPAQHGWCVLDSPVCDEAQAARLGARLLATFERQL